MKALTYLFEGLIIAIFILLLASLWSCESDWVTQGDETILNDTIVGRNEQLYQEELQRQVVAFNAATCGEFPTPADPPHAEAPQQLSEAETFESGIRCQTRSYRWEMGLREAWLYDPTSDVIWLRNILDGSSIQAGSFRPITGRLTPFTASISLENVTGDPTFRVENPTLANVRLAIANMLRDLAPTSTPAYVDSEIISIESREKTHTALKAKASGFGASINANFDWESTEVKSRFMVNFFQIYYTLDVDITQEQAADFFEPEHLPEVEVFNEHMPVYVSSIKYGRQVVFTVESAESESGVRSMLNAAFRGFGVRGEVSLSREEESILRESNIRAMIIGGDGGITAANINSVEGLLTVMSTGGNYSAQSPGVPLAYTLRYLCDHSVAQIALASEYTVRECVDVGEEYAFTPIALPSKFCPSLVNNGADNEFRGHGPEVRGELQLEQRNGNEIWLTVKVDFKELNNGSSTNSQTHGRIVDEVRIHTLPSDRTFRSFISRPEYYFSYVDNDTSPDTRFSDDFTLDGDFVNYLIVNGDSGGGDIDHCEEDDTWLRLDLRPITIMVGRQ